mmetsp:Transcript_7354/g.13079  ORF Transcript_7354/g.13079 Transcript_7354/m.13079 type:complete len:275 (-) Transcript_7354:105-929(-)
MAKTQARGKAASGKMASNSSGSGNIMDMFQARKKRRAEQVKPAHGVDAEQQSISLLRKPLEDYKEARDDIESHFKQQQQQQQQKDKKLKLEQNQKVRSDDEDDIVDLAESGTDSSVNQVWPGADSRREKKSPEEIKKAVESFPYRKTLKTVEETELKRGSLPYATFLTVHYEPQGVSEDTLQKEYGRSPREIFNENPNNCKVTQYVLDSYVLPKDFDRSLKYGPRSGLCFEERLVSAYEQGLLSPKDTSKSPEKMCRECGLTGHLCWECPSLVA